MRYLNVAWTWKRIAAALAVCVGMGVLVATVVVLGGQVLRLGDQVAMGALAGVFSALALMALVRRWE
jgi:hypothetical protein